MTTSVQHIGRSLQLFLFFLAVMTQVILSNEATTGNHAKDYEKYRLKRRQLIILFYREFN